ncbi:conserved hypothetical protein [Verticillium alfalfae VaMs.102]|uniref:DUF7730 domain-containing protein n=1 Tax=Verticillium alfalfae (strain VaMs.102 / ATCC MYA-4576 / FGSC 10136) TaxID=526221 RepID=C9STY7_VERA1|nr:conserved hypothetical protein [Verticillium alfalfae VaMs.102]EEY22298.1 conserved hypothetical protein [Verticillium alfalfae VaMs.102]
MAQRFVWRGPWFDNFMPSDGGFCNCYESLSPHNREIGIMGFLVSCRQAYFETIDILYGTNIIMLRSEVLMLHLPELLVPQRLESITSLELLIKAREVNEGQRAVRQDFSHLAVILEHVVAYCRHRLRSLCISLQGSPRSPPHTFFDGKGSPLRMIDEFYLSMEPHLNMRVEIPQYLYSTYTGHTVTLKAQHSLELREDKDGKPLWQSPWRCFDSVGKREGGRLLDEPETQWRSVGNYPRPPLQVPTEGNADKCIPSLGYWISEGEPDTTPRREHICF